MIESPPAHAWAIPEYLESSPRGLLINGVAGAPLVREFGSPLFVFSEARIRHNIDRLKHAAEVCERPLKLCYASKANSNMAILRVVREAGIDIEVNSGGELFKALRAGFRPDQIVFNGTSKSAQELDEAVAAGIYSINADSVYELDLIAAAAKRGGKRANVTLRLVPEIGTRSHLGLQTALFTSKFGISSVEVLEAFRRGLTHSEWLNLRGIHIHVGSQTPDLEPFAAAFRAMWEHLLAVYAETGHLPDDINLGGGIPVNYLRDDAVAAELPEHEREMLGAQLEPAEVLKNALRVARESARAAGAEHLFERINVLLEPGRSVIADAGIVLTTIENIKHRPETGDTWLLTDAGYNLMLSMNNYKWYYHLINASRAADEPSREFKVAGPLCDSGDVYFDIEPGGRLPDYRRLPAATVPGDVLALLNTGAYTLAQMFPYNGRPLPAAVMIRGDGSVAQIRRRDSYEDLIAQDVWS
jgi:diaminopimelate decarboxylase